MLYTVWASSESKVYHLVAMAGDRSGPMAATHPSGNATAHCGAVADVETQLLPGQIHHAQQCAQCFGTIRARPIPRDDVEAQVPLPAGRAVGVKPQRAIALAMLRVRDMASQSLGLALIDSGAVFGSMVSELDDALELLGISRETTTDDYMKDQN